MSSLLFSSVARWFIGLNVALLPVAFAPEEPLVGGTITGRVTDAVTSNGVAFTNIVATRYDASGSKFAFADASGYYTITNLTAGLYSVAFDPPLPYFAETYDNLPRILGDATPKLLAIADGQTASEVNASLRKGFIITGTVTDQTTDTPISGVNVHAMQGDGTGSYFGPTARTLGNGRYTLGPLEPNSYRLFIEPKDAHASQWFNGSATHVGATVFNLSADVADVNIILGYGSAITGTVTDPGGAGLPGVGVEVYPVGSSIRRAAATTGADGQYATSPGLAPGPYQIVFRTSAGPFVDEWFAGATQQRNAAVITVTTNITLTNIDAQLGMPNGGSISGTIFAADSGLPLAGSVSVYDSAGNFLDSVKTTTGAYAISGLAPGVYTLYFSPSVSAPYVGVYFGGSASQSGAIKLSVAAGATSVNINQALLLGGGLSGVVTIGGNPLAGVQVNATSLLNNETRSTWSLADGRYSFANLRGGAQRIWFVPPGPYLMEYYNDAALANGATPVGVAAGVTTTNINADLAAGGVITGIVTAQDTGLPLPGVQVEVRAGAVVYKTDTDMDGVYRSSGLRSGSYQVVALPGATWGQHLSATVSANVVAPGIAGSINVALARGGSISGYVCDGATSWPIGSAALVRVYAAGTGQLINSSITSPDSYYHVAVPAGTYKVRFADIWYTNAATIGAATPVTVAGTGDVLNINGCAVARKLIYLPLIRR